VEGVCSFCGDETVVAWFVGPDFATAVDSLEGVNGVETWPACATCMSLVEQGDRDELLWRGIGRLRWRADLGTESPPMEPLVRQMHQRFWAARPS